MHSPLTTTAVVELDHGDLLDAIEALLEPYDKPEVEGQAAKILRINRTLDEVPAIHRWLLQLWSWCSHWTDGYAQMFGMKNADYQKMRQRRDLLDKMASTAKMRYEAASRLITVMEGFDPTGMPRQRRSND